MGYTPILRAEFYGHVDAFGLLYDAGANLSIIKVKVIYIYNYIST